VRAAAAHHRRGGHRGPALSDAACGRSWDCTSSAAALQLGTSRSSLVRNVLYSQAFVCYKVPAILTQRPITTERHGLMGIQSLNLNATELVQESVWPKYSRVAGKSTNSPGQWHLTVKMTTPGQTSPCEASGSPTT
jgi:hypothetical protein